MERAPIPRLSLRVAWTARNLTVPAFVVDPPVLHVVAQELAESERLQAFANEISEARKGVAVEAADRKGPRARVSEPALPLLLAALHIELERGLVVVLPEDSDARDAAEAAAWFLGDDRVALLPSRGVRWGSGLEPAPHLVGERARALDVLAAGGLVAASAAAIAEDLPPAEERPQPIRLPEDADEDLTERFALAGYERVERAEERGQFAVRGGIVDVFPTTGREPLRLELFGDEIESMRAYSPFTQRTLHPVESAVIYPAGERVADLAEPTLPGDDDAPAPDDLVPPLARAPALVWQPDAVRSVWEEEELPPQPLEGAAELDPFPTGQPISFEAQRPAIAARGLSEAEQELASLVRGGLRTIVAFAHRGEALRNQNLLRRVDASFPPQAPPGRAPGRPRAPILRRPPYRRSRRARGPWRREAARVRDEGGRRRHARLSPARVPGGRQALRPARATREGLPLHRRERGRAGAVEARRQGVAAAQEPGARRHPRARRRAPPPLRRAATGAGGRVRSRARIPGAARGELPLPGDGRPAGGDRGCQGRPRDTPADGPTRLRRRRVRQDGGRRPRCLCSRAERQADADARPDDRARPAALEHLPRALPRLPAARRDGLALPQRQGDEADARRLRAGQGGRADRDAPGALERRDPEGPRARDRGRGAALWRRAEGAVAPAAPRGRRPRADGHADPAHTSHVALGPAGHLDHRDTARGPAPDQDARRRVRRGADQAGAGAGGRARRAGVLPPQPGGDDRRARCVAPGARPRPPRGRRARADAREGARRSDALVPARRPRRARLDDDHRIGPRHPAGEHADRRASRRPRARPALPDPRAGGPLRPAGPLVSVLSGRVRADAGGARAARHPRGPHRARRRLRDRDARPRDPRRGRPPRCRAVRSCRGARVRALRRAPWRGGRRALGRAAPDGQARARRRPRRRLRPEYVRRLGGDADRPAPPARARRDGGRAARARGRYHRPLRPAAGTGREPLCNPGSKDQGRPAGRGLSGLPGRPCDGRAACSGVGRAARAAQPNRHRGLHDSPK